LAGAASADVAVFFSTRFSIAAFWRSISAASAMALRSACTWT